MPKSASKDTTGYIAFLRGINVGGNKLIKMDALRKAFESLGFQNVKTLLASGNVLFEAPATGSSTLLNTIESGLEKIFKHQIDVILRTSDDIQKMIALNPFKSIKVTPDTRLYVSLLGEKPTSKLKIPYESADKKFRILYVTNDAVFSVLTLSPTNKTTDAMNILGKEFGKKITTRNWNTINKLVKT